MQDKQETSPELADALAAELERKAASQERREKTVLAADELKAQRAAAEAEGARPAANRKLRRIAGWRKGCIAVTDPGSLCLRCTHVHDQTHAEAFGANVEQGEKLLTQEEIDRKAKAAANPKAARRKFRKEAVKARAEMDYFDKGTAKPSRNRKVQRYFTRILDRHGRGLPLRATEAKMVAAVLAINGEPEPHYPEYEYGTQEEADAAHRGAHTGTPSEESVPGGHPELTGDGGGDVD